MDERAEVPECVVRRERVEQIAKEMVRSIGNRVWWSKSVSHSFTIDQRGLESAICRYLQECSF